jgi:hypothetical protein
MTLTAEIVETTSLWQAIVAAIVAGVGITVVFSLALYGFVRADDLRRGERPFLAGAFSLLGLAGLVAALAAVALGLVVMADK